MKSKSLHFVANRFIVIALVFFVALSYFVMRAYQNISMEKIAAWTEDTTADCALVLTGGPQRVREGFALLARNQVRHLIISGVNPTTELRDLLTPWDLFWGPARERIILEKRSTTTYGNAQQTLPIVEGLGCQRIALVTSALHMHRAFQTFKSSFPENMTLIKHAVPASPRHSTSLEVGNEVVKTVFYSLWAF